MEEGKDDKDACLRSRVCENALRALAAIPTTSPPITANDQATDTADPSIEEEGNVPLLVPTPHFPSLCMTASERDALLLSAKSSKALRAILLLSEGGCEGAEGVVEEAVRWVGRESLLFTSPSLMMSTVCLKLAPLLEGKKPIVLLGPLTEALYPDTSVPLHLQRIEIGPIATALLSSLSDFCAKIMAAMAKEVTTVIPDLTLGTIMGQYLWLLNFVREKWISHETNDPKEEEKEEESRLPSLVLLTFGGLMTSPSFSSPDSGALVRVIEFVSRGGSKETVSSEDTDLKEAYFGTDKKGKAGGKAKVSKEMEAVNAAPCLVRSVIWLHKIFLLPTISLSSSSSSSSSVSTSSSVTAISSYLVTCRGQREADKNAVAIIERLSVKSQGNTLLYQVVEQKKKNVEPMEADEAIPISGGSDEKEKSQHLTVMSNMGLLELLVSLILIAGGIQPEKPRAEDQEEGGKEETLDAEQVVFPSSQEGLQDVTDGIDASTSTLPHEEDVNVVAMRAVLLLTSQRRDSCLDEVGVLKVNHLNMSHFLPPDALNSTLEALHFAIDAFSKVTSSLISSVEAIDGQIRQEGIGRKEALQRELLSTATPPLTTAAINRISSSSSSAGNATNAAPSSRVEKHCAVFVAKLLQLPEVNCSRSELISAANHLICSLGDDIDMKHMQQSRKARELSDTTSLELLVKQSTTSLVQEMVDGLSLLRTTHLIAKEQLIHLLQMAGYTSSPAAFAATGFRAERLEAAGDELSASIDQLLASLKSAPSTAEDNEANNEGKEDTKEDPLYSELDRYRVMSFTKETLNTSISSPSFDDCSPAFDLLEAATHLVQAFGQVLFKGQFAITNLEGDLQRDVDQAGALEHAMLSHWDALLFSPLSNTGSTSQGKASVDFASRLAQNRVGDARRAMMTFAKTQSKCLMGSGSSETGVLLPSLPPSSSPSANLRKSTTAVASGILAAATHVEESKNATTEEGDNDEKEEEASMVAKMMEKMMAAEETLVPC